MKLLASLVSLDLAPGRMHFHQIRNLLFDGSRRLIKLGADESSPRLLIEALQITGNDAALFLIQSRFQVS